MNKFLITGSDGLVGSAIKRLIGDEHVFHTRKDVDLKDREKVLDYIDYHVRHNGVDTIINCAAKVGGVQANMKNNKGFFLENYLINNNIIEASFRNEIPNFVNLLSTCIFPDKNVKYPLTPDQIDKGAPHSSNYGYAYAKRLAGYQTSIVKNVLSKNWISIVPTNVYGIQDYFNLEEGHMIPAMIHRAYLSKKENKDMVIWGDGTQLRQIIYSDDLAKLIIWSLKNWKNDEHFMAINPKEVSTLDVAKEICLNFGIKDKNLVFDKDKPQGQQKKPAITNVPNNFKFTSLNDGIKTTVDWFVTNYPKIRK